MLLLAFLWIYEIITCVSNFSSVDGCIPFRFQRLSTHQEFTSCIVINNLSEFFFFRYRPSAIPTGIIPSDKNVSNAAIRRAQSGYGTSRVISYKKEDIISYNQISQCKHLSSLTEYF